MLLKDYRAERHLMLERTKFNRRHGYNKALKFVQRGLALLRSEYYHERRTWVERRRL